MNETKRIFSVVMLKYFEEARVLVRTGVYKDFEDFLQNAAMSHAKNDPLEKVLLTTIDAFLKMRAQQGVIFG